MKKAFAGCAGIKHEAKTSQRDLVLDVRRQSSDLPPNCLR